MGDKHFEDDIGTELTQSIERLVEEETSEAKASLEQNKPQAEEFSDITATRVMPSVDDIDEHIAKMNTVRIPESREVQSHVENRKPLPEKKKTINKKTVVIVSVVAVCLIAVVLSVYILSENRKSYEYNHDKGMEMYSQNNFESALSYFQKAYRTSEGSHDVDMIYDMYVCYTKTNDEGDALSVLNELLTLDKNNKQAIETLAAYYREKKDGESLNKLIESYQGAEGAKYLKEYQPSSPQPSVEPGKYSEPVELTFADFDKVNIYYTTDGTVPDIGSTHYEGVFTLQEGTTKIKAVAVDEIGVKSDVVELEYVITYKRTSAPDISPASGTYRYGEKIVITAEEDATVYYTLDGTTPSKSSPVYTGEIEMPEGNSIVSAMAVSKYDVASAVTRRNYIVQATRNVTYDEALSILKGRMQKLNILSSDGEHLANGQTVSFQYQSTIVVDNVEMYYIQCTTAQSGTQQQSYYGVGIQSGECYRVTGSEGSYTATVY
jgi:tetratricopeptide (TPR) repeat protein